MVTFKKMKNKFEWGETVRVLECASEYELGFELASICGIRVIETKSVSESFREPIGSILYLIEVSNGQSVEIPEKFLEKL